MVYELDDSGERVKLDITEESELGSILHPEQVVVIVKEELRRIYIWKGAKAPVRKRFISSRVAQSLQEELVKVAAFHRCKIISIDQGSEVEEFLNVFKLESMPVTEKLADMRYIRNVDRQKMLDQGIVPEEGPQVVTIDVEEDKKDEYFSPALEELNIGADEIGVISLPSAKAKTTQTPKVEKVSPSKRVYSQAKPSALSDSDKKKVMDKILGTPVPENYKRLNLILGHTLYGAVSKKVKVLGKNMEETDWEPVLKIPKALIELDDHKLRAYLDTDKGIVEAIEILEKSEKKSTEPKDATSNKPTAKRATVKQDTVNVNSEDKSTLVTTTKRKLPEVPKE